MSFPDKLKLLSEFNIIPPTLLGRYNKERNEMEHEYTKPSHEIVLGSMELCDLIFLASERFLLDTPRRLRIKFKDDDRDLIALLEPGGTKIQFFEILGANQVDDANGKYYSDRVFDFEGKPLENIKINRLENSDIELAIVDKNKWFLLLKIFSSIARNRHSVS
jgi:hypothetical protein